MTTITDNGSNIIVVKDGVTSYIPKTDLRIDVYVDEVHLTDYSGNLMVINYTEVSGAASAASLAEDIDDMIENV